MNREVNPRWRQETPRWLMRATVIFYIVLFAFLILFARPAEGAYAHQRINELASVFAGHPVNAWCYEEEFEPGSPQNFSEWAFGYVSFFDDSTLHLAPFVCREIIAWWGGSSHTPTLVAVGIMTVVHEAYHLALRYKNRLDEAATQCRTMRHLRTAFALFGGASQSDEFWRYGLWWHAEMPPQYHTVNCKIR